MKTVAWGVAKVPGGWATVRYEIENGKIVSEKRSEPELRSIVLEQFLTNIGEFWADQ